MVMNEYWYFVNFRHGKWRYLPISFMVLRHWVPLTPPPPPTKKKCPSQITMHATAQTTLTHKIQLGTSSWKDPI